MKIEKIKGIIFDYGGTIDSNGEHWAEVLWNAYEVLHIPVTKEAFREAYVHGERTLALNPLVKPEHTFYDVLLIKTEVQIKWLTDNGYLPADNQSQAYPEAIAAHCYRFVKSTLETAAPIIGQLAERYPLVLVSNFYGNIESVLKDFGLSGYFDAVIESAVVGIRKPDPAIFMLGVEKLKLRSCEVMVIGDSYKKDIYPSTQAGCHTIWLKKTGWDVLKGDETADFVINDFKELKKIFKL